jgi:hypothetical protein
LEHGKGALRRRFTSKGGGDGSRTGWVRRGAQPRWSGNHQVTAGDMAYVLPDRTVIYKPGDFVFEGGDINHAVFNETNSPMVLLLFEILPADLNGPSLIPARPR